MNAIHLPWCESHIALQSLGCCSKESLDFRYLSASHECQCISAFIGRRLFCKTVLLQTDSHVAYMTEYVWPVRFCGSGGAFVTSWRRFVGSDKEEVASNLVKTWVCGSKSLFWRIWVIFMPRMHARLGNSLRPSTLNAVNNDSSEGSVGERSSEIHHIGSVAVASKWTPAEWGCLQLESFWLKLGFYI